MTMIPVQSSNLKSVGYENGILCVEFVKGGVYSYTGVPESVYNALMNASSHGSYFAHHIRFNYPYHQIG